MKSERTKKMSKSDCGLNLYYNPHNSTNYTPKNLKFIYAFIVNGVLGFWGFGVLVLIHRVHFT